jgi:hypothetical protein
MTTPVPPPPATRVRSDVQRYIPHCLESATYNLTGSYHRDSLANRILGYIESKVMDGTYDSSNLDDIKYIIRKLHDMIMYTGYGVILQ